MIERAFLIVACHLIGDYFLQSNFLATTKGANWYHLFAHCFLYIIPFYIVFGWCWQLALIGILHFPIDALKARYGKITYVQDQVLHYVLTASFLL